MLRKHERTWFGKRHCAATGGSSVAPLSASSVVGRAIEDVVSAYGVTLVMVVLFLQAVPVGLIAFVGLLQESQFARFGWRRFRKNRSEGRPSASQSNAPKARAVLLGIVVGAGLAAFGGLIAWVAHAESSAQLMVLLSGLHAGFWSAALVLVLIGGVAPVCEEILFRGAIFGLAHANGRTWTGAITAAVLFAIGHANLRMTPYYLVVSAVNCWLLARTRTLAGPIAAHATVNLSACVAALLGVHF